MAVNLADMEVGDIAIFRDGLVKQVEVIVDLTKRAVSNHIRSYEITFNGLPGGYFPTGHAYSPNQQCNIDIVEIIKNPQKRMLAEIIREALK